jgi:hypothetical protein
MRSGGPASEDEDGTGDSLAGFLDRIAGPRKRVTVFGPAPYRDLEPLLARFDVELVHESLSVPESKGYLTVSEGERYLGSVPAAAFGELVDPARAAPWDADTRNSAFRDLTALLAGTEFSATDRRHLLATSREFEDRASRVGRGALHVGFQSLPAFRAQLPIYGRLGDETDLDVTVYGDGDWESPEGVDVAVRTESGGELGEFWVLAFDGGGDPEMACALLAEATGPNASGEYRGAWTYDFETVRALVDYLDDTYGERNP